MRTKTCLTLNPLARYADRRTGRKDETGKLKDRHINIQTDENLTCATREEQIDRQIERAKRQGVCERQTDHG